MGELLAYMCSALSLQHISALLYIFTIFLHKFYISHQMGNGKDRHQHLNSSSSSMISLKSQNIRNDLSTHKYFFFSQSTYNYIMFPRCNHVQNTLKRDINAGRTWNKHDLFDQISLVLNIYPQAIIHKTKITNKQKILLGPQR